MKNLMSLLKLYAIESLGIGKLSHSVNAKEKRKSILFLLIMIFAVVSILVASFAYSYLMAMSFEAANVMRLLPAIMFSVACVVTLFTTIYKTSGVLFAFKDYDTLMSLPIKAKTVVLSRVIIIYITNLAFIAVFLIPAVIVYAMNVNPSFEFYFNFVILFPFVPMVPIIIATAIGALISVVSSGFKHKNIVAIFFTLSIFAIVMIFSFNSKQYIEDFSNIGALIMNAVNSIYPLASMYVEGLCDYNIISFVLFILISLGLFFGFLMVLSLKYNAINTMLTTTKSNANYKITTLKKSSLFVALYKKELRRYFSSYMYVLNTAIGLLMLTIACVALVFSDAATLEKVLEIPGFAAIINSVAPVAMAIFCSLTCTTSVSISLEGKSLWIIKSLPINTRDIFLSKILVNMTLVIPTVLINATILIFKLKLDPIQSVLCFITPILYGMFVSMLGVVINLYYPKFGWDNEMAVIKQSASVMLTMVVGLLVVAVPIALIVVLPSVSPVLITCVATVAMLGLNAILYKHLLTSGSKIFKAL